PSLLVCLGGSRRSQSTNPVLGGGYGTTYENGVAPIEWRRESLWDPSKINHQAALRPVPSCTTFPACPATPYPSTDFPPSTPLHRLSFVLSQAVAQRPAPTGEDSFITPKRGRAGSLMDRFQQRASKMSRAHSGPSASPATTTRWLHQRATLVVGSPPSSPKPNPNGRPLGARQQQLRGNMYRKRMIALGRLLDLVLVSVQLQGPAVPRVRELAVPLGERG
ncbi:hypothetical protein BGZ61DRAFT_32856, partial [Ilyonectria robusta]|uniref:uncharacterized protein n=1 Tax=Ilyonectria robusta TaxID=1079257 RepID=UPI001E8E12FD